MRSFDPSGKAVGDPAQVNVGDAGDQEAPDVKILPGLRPVIVWQSLKSGAPSWDIWLRILPPLDLPPLDLSPLDLPPP